MKELLVKFIAFLTLISPTLACSAPNSSSELSKAMKNISIYGLITNGFIMGKMGPSQKALVSPDIKKIQSPANFAWLSGRAQANLIANLAKTNKFQDHLKLKPLSTWGETESPATKNWLPTPQENFNLLIHFYKYKMNLLHGESSPPAEQETS